MGQKSHGRIERRLTAVDNTKSCVPLGAFMISISDTVQQGSEQVSTEVDGDVVMMSIAQGHYFGLDDIGSHIWKLIEQPVSVENVCETLCDEYAVERATCERDVLDLLNDMLERELIKTL